MDAVLRGATMYLFLLLVFRLAGRRTLAQTTVFDLALLLIISEATQNAMLGDDYSVTNGMLVILTLVGIDILLSLVKQRAPLLEGWLDGKPLVLIDEGRPSTELMRRARVDLQDILRAAREQGVCGLDRIRYAVLETSGSISIIPREFDDPTSTQNGPLTYSRGHGV
ncbi:DUF421 domain-containing protein [Nitrospira defluvii]|uniref:YetF C-terminal domain-containing protein n=1 Tax=Nitrospira defluvii TaxID=330214 RepID=A0ABN7L2B5_9BACT|nr:YetF domain-containing protein [Nitrospira defluvii]CAE6727246.1 conserved hypothetical protein [Nitrospira defluvii]